MPAVVRGDAFGGVCGGEKEPSEGFIEFKLIRVELVILGGDPGESLVGEAVVAVAAIHGGGNARFNPAILIKNP